MDSEEFEENEQDDPSEELKENEPPKNSPYLKDVRRTKDFFVSHTRYKDDSVIGEFKGMPTLWDLKAMTPDNWLKNNLTHRCSKSVKAAKIRNDLKGEIDKIHAFTGLPGHLCLLLALYMHDLCISDMKSLKSSSISIPVSTPNGIDYISSIFKGDINIKNESPRQTETNKILQHNEDVTDKRKGTKTTRNTDLEHWPSYYSKIGQHCVTDPEENKQVDQMKVRVIARNVRVGNKNKKKRRAALSDTQKQEIVYFFDENERRFGIVNFTNWFEQTYDDYCKNTEFNQLIDTPIHLLTRPGGYGILNTQQHNALMKAVYKGDSEICIKNVKFPLEQKSDANSNNANEQKIQVYREDVTLKIGKTKDDISFTCKTRAILVDTWNDQYHKPLFKIDTVLEDILHTGVLNPGKYDIILLFSYTAIICDLNNIDENVIKDILTDCRQHKLSYLFKTKVDKIEREKLKLTGGPMEK
eukprot:508515_1